SSDDVARANRSSNEQSAAVAAISARPQGSGIWGILREIFGLSRKVQTIHDAIRRTDDLAETVKGLQTPLRSNLKQLISQSDSILNQPDSKDPAVLAQQKSTLDGLTNQFKLISASLLPLSKEAILLDVYKKNLANWHGAAKSEYSTDLKNLAVRLLGL